MSDRIEVYTDGAFDHQTQIGGWAFVGPDLEKSGTEGNTATSNRMEMTAIIKAIEAHSGPLLIHTDSMYCVRGCTDWLHRWKSLGWRRKKSPGKKSELKNSDLWIRLDELLEARDIIVQWVKGHSGIAGNERADTLAEMAARNLGEKRS